MAIMIMSLTLCLQRPFTRGSSADVISSNFSMSPKNNILMRLPCHYIPFAITPGMKFRNPLYDDRRASCFIYKVPRTGIYRRNDFGDPTCSGDCFWFVAALHGMDLQKDFPRILEKIIRDLSLSISLPESASGTAQFGIDSTQVLHSTSTLAEPLADLTALRKRTSTKANAPIGDSTGLHHMCCSAMASDRSAASAARRPKGSVTAS